jgi:hypothetical protein
MFLTFEDVRAKLAKWKGDFNHIQPHDSFGGILTGNMRLIGNQAGPAEASP